MIEILYSNINTLKIIVFSIVNFILIIFYAKRKNKYLFYGNKVKLIFLFILLIFFHTIFFSFKKVESLIEVYSTLSVITMIFLFLKLYGKLKVLKFYEKFITFMCYYLIGSSTIILLFFNSPAYYSSGNFLGLVSNSNTLGLYFVFMTPLLINKFFNHTGWRNKLFFKVLILMDVIWIVFLTRSRTAFAVLLIILALFLFFNTKNTYGKFKLIFFSFIAASIFIFTFTQAISSYLVKNNKENASLFMTREALWGARIYAITQKPYFGWGYTVNEFTEFVPGHENNKKEKGNLILAIFEEFGFIFGLIFFAILYSIFKNAINIYRYQKDKLYLSITIIAVLFHSMFETWVLNFYSFLAILFWLVILSAFQYKNS
jgi:O-antigen ligase